MRDIYTPSGWSDDNTLAQTHREALDDLHSHEALTTRARREARVCVIDSLTSIGSAIPRFHVSMGSDV